jgi:anaerobic selenocysteine-containing dehydrogenase
MANIVPDSFKQELFTATHNFSTTGGNTFYLSLYTTVTGFSASTTNYITTNEASGTGYTAGGTALVNSTVTVAQNISFISFSNATFSTATLSASCCLIYNTTQSKKAVVVLDFTTTQTATNGNFTIQFPTANSTSAVLRIS